MLMSICKFLLGIFVTAGHVRSAPASVVTSMYIPGLGHRGVDTGEVYEVLVAVPGPIASFEILDRNPIRGTTTFLLVVAPTAAALEQINNSPNTGNAEEEQVITCVFDPSTPNALCKESEFLIVPPDGAVLSESISTFTEQRFSVPLTLPPPAVATRSV